MKRRCLLINMLLHKWISVRKRIVSIVYFHRMKYEQCALKTYDIFELSKSRDYKA